MELNTVAAGLLTLELLLRHDLIVIVDFLAVLIVVDVLPLLGPSGKVGEVGGRTHWELCCSSYPTISTEPGPSEPADDRGKALQSWQWEAMVWRVRGRVALSKTKIGLVWRKRSL
uniref:Uncharacterized protein n=1 Tax=Ananas comosus var. bracteatus TaxID=296719 RepID=A0A6V7P1I1_ANACO|nr:unnamed protein product [Ananas comosus var. bracteatus]